MKSITQMVPLDAIAESGTNPRKRWEVKAMAELTESVRTHGVIQPILVRPIAGRGEYHIVNDLSDLDKTLRTVVRGAPDKDRHQVANGLTPKQASDLVKRLNGADYLLVAGERRWRAARAAGLKEIPAVVRELDDKAALELQVLENLQRADLHPIEEAEGYEKLMAEHGYTADQLAAKVGKSKAYIYARLKLTALCPPARKALWEDKINHSVALLIARIPDPESQTEALKQIRSDHYGDGPMPEKQVRRYIHEQFMLRLKDAPFDTRDADLVPEAGPCAACPKRTGNQRELFPDVQSGDVCTDPKCFARKKEAAVARKLQEAEAQGHPVLKADEAFSKYGSLNNKYVDLTARCQALGWQWDKNWRETLGKHCPPAMVVVNSEGEIRELLPADVAREALKATGRKPKRDPSDRQANAYEEKRKLMRRAAALATEQLLPKLVPLLHAKDARQAKLWAAVARAAYDCTGIEVHEFVAKRRGLVESQTEARAALQKWLKSTTESQALQAFTLELLLCAHWSGQAWQSVTWGSQFKAVAKLAKVNLARCEREAKKPKKK